MKKIFAIISAIMTGAVSLSMFVPSGVEAALSTN